MSTPGSERGTQFRVSSLLRRIWSGCQWNQLPKMFGDDRSVHGWFQRWVREGVFEELWASLITDCVSSGSGNRSIAALAKRSSRAKKAAKTNGSGETGNEEKAQHLCLDKACGNPIGQQVAGYVPHIRRFGEEKLGEKGCKGRPAPRWVVERTLGWLEKCRAILVHYEKK